MSPSSSLPEGLFPTDGFLPVDRLEPKHIAKDIIARYDYDFPGLGSAPRSNAPVVTPVSAQSGGMKKQSYLADTFAALRALDSERNDLTVLAISTDFLTAILQSLHGLTCTEPARKMRICLMSITPKFSLGYPEINAAFEGQWNERAIHFEAEGVLKHEPVHAGGLLRIIILRLTSTELVSEFDEE
jgi:hypothetical protein